MKIHVLGNRHALKKSGENKGKEKITGLVILEMTKLNQRKDIVMVDILTRQTVSG